MVGGCHFVLGVPSIVSCCLHKNASVAEILSYNENGLSWNLSFTRDLYEWEVNLVDNLVELLHEVYISKSDPNIRIWSPSSDGKYLTKSFFHVISKDSLSHPSFPSQQIW